MSASLAPQLAVRPKVYREGSLLGWWEVLGNNGDASSRRGEMDNFGEWGKFRSCVSAQQKLGYKMF